MSEWKGRGRGEFKSEAAAVVVVSFRIMESARREKEQDEQKGGVWQSGKVKEKEIGGWLGDYIWVNGYGCACVCVYRPNWKDIGVPLNNSKREDFYYYIHMYFDVYVTGK